MGIRTRLTEALGITVPILSAPVAMAMPIGLIGNLPQQGMRASAAVLSPGHWP